MRCTSFWCIPTEAHFYIVTDKLTSLPFPSTRRASQENLLIQLKFWQLFVISYRDLFRHATRQRCTSRTGSFGPLHTFAIDQRYGSGKRQRNSGSIRKSKPNLATNPVHIWITLFSALVSHGDPSDNPPAPGLFGGLAPPVSRFRIAKFSYDDR